MCLQDLQLARSELLTVHPFSFSGAGVSQILPQNPIRTRLLILGPSAGNMTVFLGDGNFQNSVTFLTAGGAAEARILDVTRYGIGITNRIFVNVSALCAVVVYEYTQATDPETLKRLAATGKW